VLADASNNEMFMWSGLSVDGGEIYASNATSISWANVNCYNLTAYNDEEEVFMAGNLTDLELYLGL